MFGSARERKVPVYTCELLVVSFITGETLYETG